MLQQFKQAQPQKNEDAMNYKKLIHKTNQLTFILYIEPSAHIQVTQNILSLSPHQQMQQLVSYPLTPAKNTTSLSIIQLIYAGILNRKKQSKILVFLPNNKTDTKKLCLVRLFLAKISLANVSCTRNLQINKLMQGFSNNSLQRGQGKIYISKILPNKKKVHRIVQKYVIEFQTLTLLIISKLHLYAIYNRYNIRIVQNFINEQVSNIKSFNYFKITSICNIQPIQYQNCSKIISKLHATYIVQKFINKQVSNINSFNYLKITSLLIISKLHVTYSQYNIKINIFSFDTVNILDKRYQQLFNNYFYCEMRIS
eukprot:TRINITY_DN8770_c0_g1_i10.p1 TRINITY_DN8770_c0_g1~~TRINITY_DN8770_c0_g1_i10.p1  ORF type:complete len:312 (+),score=-25.99 TRINITY_DN8770_c0_g1_i10:167-1102(+)